MRSSADLGLLIHAIRVRHGLSQADLAARLGISQRYLSELETGKPKVLNEKFFDVLRDLGIVLSFRETIDE
ncbi:helix-turn-helix domain-containing protein [Arthrobacter sp. H14]|uniref:helix-turn-helix domain-containing protein n=1 Tax=Arthrobacter sp. H14 TaxID=1312959 RepID=UPI0004B9984D|nr:helix-turn-helix domain-containing protein [Arthrobacter sp. H14]